MSFAISSGIQWVGKIDWELRRFHGEEYSTHRGSTYNSYLVRDEKTVLIDTVWTPFAGEFVEKLKQTIPLEEIDFIVANHAESDHSGALPALLREIPGTPVYCTANGVKSLKGHYHGEWNFRPVKTGERLSIGSKELVFVEAPMLHWPDSMFCYLTEDEVLFSNDAFGQHYASQEMYNDLVDQAELFQECVKYYANILTPFSALVDRKIKEFLSLNLPLKMICPSHGVLWRRDPAQIVKKYAEWAGNYQEDRIAVIYDTMWNGTRAMAEAIAEGLRAAGGDTHVAIYNCARSDRNDIITDVFRSKAVLVGSPTVNKGILSSVAALLEEIRSLGFRNKKAAAFGAYGWSGESVKVIESRLKEAGFEIIGDGLRQLWNPDAESLERCASFGKELAGAISAPESPRKSEPSVRP